MKRTSRDDFLDQALGALVGFFGLDAVKDALAILEVRNGVGRKGVHRPAPQTRGSLPKSIAELDGPDPERFKVLRAFFVRLGDRELLRDSEDIRRFAELAGSKGLTGKSRRDLIAKLPPLLLPLALDELRALLKKAEGVSEEERRQGYSVLTDHLLRKTPPAKT